MKFFDRLICTATHHEYDWARVPGRWGGEIMRGSCRRCGENATAAVPETSNWFFNTPGLAERFPNMAAFLGRHHPLDRPTAEIIQFPVPRPSNVVPFRRPS